MAQFYVTPEQIALADKKLPTSARVFARLQKVLEDVNTDVSDIVGLVKVDTALSAGVVRSSNCVFFRRGTLVTSIDEAINRIGLREVNRLVGLTMSGQLFAAAVPMFHLKGDQLWQNSIATAVAMSSLMQLAGEDERSGYTLGLLRPVGRLVLQRIAPDEILPTPATNVIPGAAARAWERSTFTKTSSEVSAILMSQWGFPFAMSAAVRHHDNLTGAVETSRIGALLHIACWVSATLGKGLPCEEGAFGLSDDVLKLADLPDGAAESCVVDTRGELNQLQDLMRPAVMA